MLAGPEEPSPRPSTQTWSSSAGECLAAALVRVRVNCSRAATGKSLATSGRYTARLVFLFICALTLLYYFHYSSPRRHHLADATQQTTTTTSTRQYVLKYPKTTPPKGLVLLFHGCTHSKEDWLFLPEEVRILEILLGAGYAAAAFSSEDRQSGCWHEDVDVPTIRYILTKELLVDHPEFLALPAFVLGASSGGTFAAIFPVYLHDVLRFRGACIIISPGVELPPPPSTPEPPSSSPNILLEIFMKKSYPARVAVVYMSKDRSWATRERAEEFGRSILPYQNRSGSTTPSIIYLEAKPISLKSYRRFPAFLAPARKSVLIEALTKQGDVDERGYFRLDPRGLARSPGPLADFLAEMGRLDDADDEVASHSPSRREQMEEIFNVCYGEHEMSSERIREVVEYWDAA